MIYNTKYQIIRSGRKSISLHIENDGSLTVRAPYNCPKSAVEQCVKDNASWIAARQAKLREFNEKHKKGTIPYLGKNYNAVYEGNEIKIGDDKIYAPSEDELIKWLCREAARILEERSRHFIKVMNVSPSAIKLSNARSKWGSCSSKKSVNFSWRLIFCPTSVIDYLVVHEFSHLTHMNHSKEFWARVGEFLPEYKKERNWLKENAKLLELM